MDNNYSTSIQTAVFTKHGCTRIIKYAFEYAMKRRKKELSSSEKSILNSIYKNY